jgi:outer membrane protein TolC
VTGITCGSVATFGVGCRSSADPIPDLASHPPVTLYPGLSSRAVPPAVLRDDARADPSRHAAVLPDTTAGRVRAAGAVEAPGATSSPPKPGPDPVGPPAASGPEETIDLGVALRLAGVDNPTINLAREQVREALATQLAARSLLLPSVNVGGNYHNHQGALQASPGFIRTVNSQSLYLGFGARTLAAESVAFPGVRLFAHLGDAVYEPLAARQRVAARRSDAQAVHNDVLLRVAAAYLELVGAEARLAVLRQGEADVSEVTRLTRVYAEKGQGRQGDADRAASHADLVRREIHRAGEDVAVASAELGRLLSLDPSVRLRTPGGAVLPFRLVPETSEPEPLVAEALRTRPEVFARSAEVQEAQARVRQERVRPWVPLVSVGYSGGLFGGGSNLVDPSFGPLKGRSDFDAFAVWNVQNLGLGNVAQVRRTGAVVGQAVAAYDLAGNQVRREVVEALADARAAARQIETARTSLVIAEEGFGLEMRRVVQGGPGFGRPIEILDSFQQLLDARQELVRAVVGFDVAQFRLFVAVGSNPLAGASAAAVPIPGMRR